MTEEERFAYLAGFIEMGHFLLANSGRREMGECLIGWFYTERRGYNELLSAFERAPDKQVTAILWPVVNRVCGAESSQQYGLVHRTPPKDTMGFDFGSTEMAALLARKDGNPDRSACIIDWYTQEGTVKRIFEMQQKNPEVTREQLLEALIRMECGTPES